MNSSRWRSTSPKHFAVLSLVAFGFAAGACVSDDPAPRCFHTNEAGKCVLIPPGQRLELSCNDLPKATALADFTYAPVLAGSSGDVKFEATNLPAGLSIDEKTGVISGNILNEGTYADIKLSVQDNSFGIEASTTCDDLKVGDRLVIDTSQLPDGCVGPSDNLKDLAVGGSEADFTCRLPSDKEDKLCSHGSGNGYLPDGLTFSEGCKISGEIRDEAEGTYAWIGLVEQDGAEVAVPFCARRDGPEPHDVTVRYMGDDVDPLHPLQLQLDSDGVSLVEGDVQFEATAACANGTCSRVAARYGATCSPFTVNGGDAIAPIELVSGTDGPVGLTHPLIMSATTIPEKLEGRPWITNFTFRYCTASNDPADSPATDVCDGLNALETQYIISFIVQPQ